MCHNNTVKKNRNIVSILVPALIALISFFVQQYNTRNTPITNNNPSTSSNPFVVRNQQIQDQTGKIVFTGDINLEPVLARIARGERDSHPNDGSVHSNREGKLPRQSDRNYYHEYVVRTPNLRNVGPQRLILGKQNEVFYTPDHYKTFLKLR